MSEKKPFVKNAADKNQVKSGKAKEKEMLRLEKQDIKDVLQTPQGRRLTWKIMSRCGIYSSVQRAGQEQVNYLSGQQDLGMWLMAQIVDADENLLFKMMVENKNKHNTGDSV